jgi:hypothetical protein
MASPTPTWRSMPCAKPRCSHVTYMQRSIRRASPALRLRQLGHFSVRLPASAPYAKGIGLSPVGQDASDVLSGDHTVRGAGSGQNLECGASASLRPSHVAEPMPSSSRTGVPIGYPSEGTAAAAALVVFRPRYAGASAKLVPNRIATRPRCAPRRTSRSCLTKDHKSGLSLPSEYEKHLRDRAGLRACKATYVP